ncbi:MliC family protein [Deinococcus sp.]
MPQVRSASGVKYQNSEWTWFSQGQEGSKKWPRTAARNEQSCRSEPV